MTTVDFQGDADAENYAVGMTVLLGTVVQVPMLIAWASSCAD